MKTAPKALANSDEKKDEPKKEEKKEEPKKEEKKEEPKKEEKKEEEPKKEEKKDEPKKEEPKEEKTDSGDFGGLDGKQDPYFDADFKMLEAADGEFNYEREEKAALKQPLRVADMQSIEASLQ